MDLKRLTNYTNGKAAKVLKHLIRWLTEIETRQKECQTSKPHKSIFRLIMASAINTVNKAEFKVEMVGSFKKVKHIFLIIFCKNMYKRNNTP